MEADNKKQRSRKPPARSDEARRQQLIAKAYDLAEELIDNKTASSQVVTLLLKEGTEKAKLELEKLRKENELLKAKTEALESYRRQEELYAEAIRAISSYQGNPQEDLEDSND